jgi:hypothetical protein
VLKFYDHEVGAFTDDELDRLKHYCDGLPLDKRLAHAGRKDEVQKQFALAAVLDLSSDDKTELARLPQTQI